MTIPAAEHLGPLLQQDVSRMASRIAGAEPYNPETHRYFSTAVLNAADRDEPVDYSATFVAVREFLSRHPAITSRFPALIRLGAPKRRDLLHPAAEAVLAHAVALECSGGDVHHAERATFVAEEAFAVLHRSVAEMDTQSKAVEPISVIDKRHGGFDRSF